MVQKQSKLIVRPKVYNCPDVYLDFVEKLLQENPEYWTKYNKNRRMRHFWVYTQVGSKIVEVINFDRWKDIISYYFISAQDRIIQGEALVMGNYVGKIQARRVERNHAKKTIDFHKTGLQPKVADENGKLKPEKIIYFTDDDWIRIGWVKTGKIPNETVYRFKPAQGDSTVNGFKEKFSSANSKNPALKYTYTFYPFDRVKKLKIGKQ